VNFIKNPTGEGGDHQFIFEFDQINMEFKEADQVGMNIE